MPITYAFDSADYQNSVLEIVRQHFGDYFSSADYVLPLYTPNVETMTKAVIWLSFYDVENLDRLRTHRNNKSLQRKEVRLGITLLTNAKTRGDKGPANLIRKMASTIERTVILRDGYKLANAGLYQAEMISPFTDIIEDVNQEYYRRFGVLAVTVYVEAS